MQMLFKFFYLLFFISFFINDFASAQDLPVKKDSTTLYRNIESYSKRSKLNTLMFRIFFKPVPVESKKEVKKKVYKKLIQKPYSAFQRKIIRKINIVTLDPFGYSTTDTTSVTHNRFIKAANDLHLKTRISKIRNLLLFSENEPFNSFFVKESERLIRNQQYVHDVSFYVVSTGAKSDSVDIFIRELDIWSISPKIVISPSRLSLGITDKNILGSGHEFKNVYERNFIKGINVFNSTYFIPNIKSTYINSRLHIGIDGNGNSIKSLTIDRPFYSPYATWAAGVSFAYQVKKDSLKDLDPLFVPLNLKFNTQDFWAGKAIRIFKGSTEEEMATNLIISGRYLRVRYGEKPSELNDPLDIYSNEDFYLAGIGISTRKYVQDTYVFKYGLIEDVPVGKVIELTGGYQVRNDTGRTYLGIRVSFGNYRAWGYLSSNFEYGTFFNSSRAEQGVIKASLNYFTGLFEIGRWKFRQFCKPQITFGINRFSYDSLTLNEGHGLDGFNSTGSSGTNRLIFTVQTQTYAPWNFLGFHFGPFITYSFGMLGDAGTGFKKSKVYSQLGLGVLIKNFNLVFNTFQLSISFYPFIPGVGQNVFKMNSYKTTDFGFRDFEIERPVPVIYR
jgi:hypothetical protein